MATRALKPVEEITQTAQNIAHGANLSERIPIPEVQDEIGNLANTFNEMMDRLEKSFAQVRQFSSDASHELRTPLTVLKGQSELVLGKPRSKLEYQEKHKVSRNGEEIELTGKEYSLLEYFMRNEGKVLTRTMIAEHVWDYNFDTFTNVIDVYVNHLRKKIDKKYPAKLLHTLRGVGYVMRV